MQTTPRRRIAVTGGGTAGHILTALDLLEAYRRIVGAEGFFLGCAAGMERTLVPARGVRLEIVPGLPWARENGWGRLRALSCVHASVLAARKILLRENVELLIGTGGYASLGACLAAFTLGIPFVIHESNVEPGLANRILSGLASLVCVGFEETTRYFPRGATVTGIPVAPLQRVAPRTAPAGAASPVLLVLGGSEGAPVLNVEAPRLFAQLRRRGVSFSVRHLVGFASPAATARAYALAGVDATVAGFVDDMPSVYAGATLAISTAGARTLAELSTAGVPAFLAPMLSAANDHQSSNARVYSAGTGAVLLPPGSWDTAALAIKIHALLADPVALGVLRKRALSWGQANAGADLVIACERLIASRLPAPHSHQPHSLPGVPPQ